MKMQQVMNNQQLGGVLSLKKSMSLKSKIQTTGCRCRCRVQSIVEKRREEKRSKTSENSSVNEEALDRDQELAKE